MEWESIIYLQCRPSESCPLIVFPCQPLDGSGVAASAGRRGMEGGQGKQVVWAQLGTDRAARPSQCHQDRAVLISTTSNHTI